MEQVPDTFASLFTGYTVVWVILALYILSMIRRLKQLEDKLDPK